MFHSYTSCPARVVIHDRKKGNVRDGHDRKITSLVHTRTLPVSCGGFVLRGISVWVQIPSMYVMPCLLCGCACVCILCTANR